MLLVDANVLIYAVDEDAEHHARAQGWLDEALGGPETVGFAWVVTLAFLRLATRRGIFHQPLDVVHATGVVDGWLARPAASVVHPTDAHAEVLSGLLRDVGTAGNLVSDAHLAALAIEHDAEVVSFDRDFERLPGVRWRTPA